MRPILSILTGATCGDNCWHAREEVCRCSCGGVNHGCLLEEGKERPARTCRIKGEVYTLVTMGLLNEIYPQAKVLNDQVWKQLTKGPYVYHYPWRETDQGAPGLMKCASRDQIAKWPELKAASQLPEVLSGRRSVYLLWRNDKPLVPVYCELSCAKCLAKKTAFNNPQAASL